MDTHISVKMMTLIVLATAIWEEPGAAIMYKFSLVMQIQ